jgi:hypothetical protein
VRLVYDPRGLTGVTTVRPWVAGVLHKRLVTELRLAKDLDIRQLLIRGDS